MAVGLQLEEQELDLANQYEAAESTKRQKPFTITSRTTVPSGSSYGAGSSKPPGKSTVTLGTKRKSAANPIGIQESGFIYTLHERNCAKT
ncbi:hypothetical protein COLO4_24747 [Corchorus olitorius]|uniref:Uncharacterized protein n=1 Tax=Corchorus olitorius TaxID=93759 RepID=A0A1R3I790_9ROSI|nr:hypothetical protein COLO4_24747 [Corchorus olitorius]